MVTILGKFDLVCGTQISNGTHNDGFVLLLISFIANVLQCKARFKSNFKCMYVTMCSLVMSIFSRDYIKTEVD